VSESSATLFFASLVLKSLISQRTTATFCGRLYSVLLLTFPQLFPAGLSYSSSYCTGKELSMTWQVPSKSHQNSHSPSCGAYVLGTSDQKRTKRQGLLWPIKGAVKQLVLKAAFILQSFLIPEEYPSPPFPPCLGHTAHLTDRIFLAARRPQRQDSVSSPSIGARTRSPLSQVQSYRRSRAQRLGDTLFG